MGNGVRGKYFEDFSIGELFNSRGRTITETDVVQFVNLAWYTNPRCTDDEIVNSDQQTCLVARRPNKGGSARRAVYRFATPNHLEGAWECPLENWEGRHQAQMVSHYFEDFKVGDAFDTRARTVTEADVAG